MSKLAQIGAVLSDNKWHLGNDELAIIQPRFSASILLLRMGKLDGLYWNIEKRRTEDKRQWEYRLVSRSRKPYQPQSPQCQECGSFNVHVRDDRT